MDKSYQTAQGTPRRIWAPYPPPKGQTSLLRPPRGLCEGEIYPLRLSEAVFLVREHQIAGVTNSPQVDSNLIKFSGEAKIRQSFAFCHLNPAPFGHYTEYVLAAGVQKGPPANGTNHLEEIQPRAIAARKTDLDLPLCDWRSEKTASSALGFSPEGLLALAPPALLRPARRQHPQTQTLKGNHDRKNRLSNPPWCVSPKEKQNLPLRPRHLHTRPSGQQGLEEGSQTASRSREASTNAATLGLAHRLDSRGTIAAGRCHRGQL